MPTSSILAADLRSLPPSPPRGRTCGIQMAAAELEQVDPEAHEAFQAAVSNPKVSAKVLADRMRAAGYHTATRDSLYRHRRGDCLCGTK